MALANLPMVPNVIPSPDEPASAPQAAAGVDPLHGRRRRSTPRPTAGSARSRSWPGPTRRSTTASSAGARRVQGELRAAGPVAKGKPIVAFGGNANMPMTITLRGRRVPARGRREEIYEPIVCPRGKMDNGIAACRAEMTVGGETKEIWLEPLGQPRPAPAADRHVPRRGLRRSPTTSTASRWASSSSSTTSTSASSPAPSSRPIREPGPAHRQVRRDQGPAAHDLDEPPARPPRLHLLPVELPCRDIDPHTDRPTGQFQSVFQVATNPGRPIIYAGCLLVVLGTFVQFYMRAGVFTDGGKKERERAAAKARKPTRGRRPASRAAGRALTELEPL